MLLPVILLSIFGYYTMTKVLNFEAKLAYIMTWRRGKGDVYYRVRGETYNVQYTVYIYLSPERGGYWYTVKT